MRMTRQTTTTQHGGPDDCEAEAKARIEALETSAADAEARAATALEELASARETSADLEGQLAEAKAARDKAEGELARTRSEAEDTRSRLSEAVVKYREAKLAAAPEVPQDLVPPAETVAEIDEGFEAARRVVGQLRERIEDERLSPRVPVGSPSRRAADLSSLSASEKIRVGLRELSEREAR
jgi:chromosome segregation ATPase